ncbi:cytochrome-c peroxidase [Microbulbifer sp. THAF38]|uniref:cytochrome-c peroxidase n=1 Tax=Microbulbifer sp. THAF38 TaxID=2587856 RepID=UPI001268C5EC|nr:cytochrome c peroxidase [Microbulbifer sp. THAF38]QFT53869.1 Cytochrome c551 peroxidase precursor [Microbulbifer sp. THAF38]
MQVQILDTKVFSRELLRLFFLMLFLSLAGCDSGASGGGDNPAPDAVQNDSDSGTDSESDSEPEPEPEPEPEAEEGSAPNELIGHAYSGTSIGLAWERDGETYFIYRNGEKIAQTSNSFFVDHDLSVDTEYVYSVNTADTASEIEASRVAVKTLVNNTNAGLNNGTEDDVLNERISTFAECKNASSALDLLEEDLDNCLAAMLELNRMASLVEDIRAFAARVRSEQEPVMVELGMRLFHNKSLSANQDASCSSCHHPAIGCGGDNLSMPVGVNAIDVALLGPGRSDGVNEVPLVPRNAQPICNASLWSRGLFWDNRVSMSPNGVLRTDSRDVTNNTAAAVGSGSLALLMAQAHFPVTAPPEMGDIIDFGYDDTVDENFTAYREDILAANLDIEAWAPLFISAFGDGEINFSRIAQAIAAYEAVQIFIDNPFFAYVEGNLQALSTEEKRGAITFMSRDAGCTFCHKGAFFTSEALMAANYPQIGIGTDESGSGADLGGEGSLGFGAFRAPTLLNVAITGPWGHNGQFASLRRNVEHYRDQGASIASYFANNEMCDLEQFKDLQDCPSKVAPNGLALSQDILAENDGGGVNRLTDDEIDLVVTFLDTLTDPNAANSSSNEIQFLIPPRDGGPDGKQLDAKNRSGDNL